jgi:hypothetical protein
MIAEKHGMETGPLSLLFSLNKYQSGYMLILYGVNDVIMGCSENEAVRNLQNFITESSRPAPSRFCPARPDF